MAKAHEQSPCVIAEAMCSQFPSLSRAYKGSGHPGALACL
jgi:hypothetical protein